MTSQTNCASPQGWTVAELAEYLSDEDTVLIELVRDDYFKLFAESESEKECRKLIKLMNVCATDSVNVIRGGKYFDLMKDINVKWWISVGSECCRQYAVAIQESEKTLELIKNTVIS